MYKLLLLLSTVLYLNVGKAQNNPQNVDFLIECSLDDNSKTVTGTTKFTYTNKSTDTLKYLFIHLWPNAYSSKNTAFAKQQLKLGKKEFQLSSEDEMGAINKLKFSSNDQALNWSIDDNNPDIATIILNTPLLPNQTVDISTPFNLKVPKLFSRMGHANEDFYITQWYPKPAVYDKKGWHPMPYLSQGEFYSEFGAYKVNITVPKDYVVAATGQEVNTTSANDKKTYHFEAKNVHDFAWFASKDFTVKKDSITLNNKTIQLATYIHTNHDPAWSKSMDYLKNSLRFYTEKVGDYPYPTCKVVEGALLAGAGMEYPMITIIGSVEDYGDYKAAFLDEVIAHEVGHNWFYGSLGSNERTEPFLDEAINSYIEGLYMDKYHPELDAIRNIWKTLLKNRIQSNNNVPVVGHSTSVSEMDYYINNYAYGPSLLKYLAAYLGEQKMNQFLTTYTEKFAFKHPQLNDFFETLERVHGGKIDWFTQDLLQTTKTFDYSITNIRNNQINLKNKGEVAAPFKLSYFKHSDLIKESEWIDGFVGQKSIPFTGDSSITKIIIDYADVSPDVNKTNNKYYLDGKNNQSEKKFVFLNPTNTNNSHQITPVLGYNVYDNTQIGVGLHNFDLEASPFEYYLLPAYSTGAQSLIGRAGARYHLHSKGNLLKEIVFKADFKSYHYFQNSKTEDFYRYFSYKPSIDFHLKTKRPQALSIKSPINVFERSTDNKLQFIPRLEYTFNNGKKTDLLSLRSALEFQQYELSSTGQEHYLKLELEAKQTLDYKMEGKSAELRAFGGVFLDNTRRDNGVSANSLVGLSRGNFSSSQHAYNDYALNGDFFGRSEGDEWSSHQIGTHDGFSKLPLRNSPLGRSSDYMFALNAKADLPIPLPKFLPLKLFADAVWYQYKPTTKSEPENSEKFIADFGLMLDFYNVVGIYLPLMWNNSNESLEIQMKQFEKPFDRITFSINMDALQPEQLRESLFKQF